MNTIFKRFGATVLAAGLLLGASACSSDEKAEDAPVENEGTTTDDPSTPPGDQQGDEPSSGVDAGAAIDAVGVEGVASAMVTAMGAERFEMQGEELHLYLSEDGRIKDAMSACIVAGSLVAEADAVIVIHDDAGATTC